MTPTDTITVLIIIFGGTFIAAIIIHLIADEIEHRRWSREVKDDTRRN